MSTLLTRRPALVAGLALFGLMAATRSHHVGDWNALPDASWAIFFLAGLWLAPRVWLPVLMAFAVGIDFAATTWGGVSDFCITGAYWMLLPTYAVLYAGGRLVAGRGAAALAGGTLAAAACAEILSGGSFYFGSGYFAQPTLAGYAGEFVNYFLTSLGVMVLYVAVAVLVRAAVESVRPQHVR